jgi:UDPglucose 6-dehydrogenase
MNVGVIGTGYVGLVTGCCFAEVGNQVCCYDIDAEKIKQLKQAKVPIYEPGIEELMALNTASKRLTFTHDISHMIDHVDVIFIAVGTPSEEDGSADIKQVLKVAETIGQLITQYCVVVTKSTVPVGTTIEVGEIIEQQIKNRGLDCHVDVASNPEFLKEGAAIHDFMYPDRIVLGADSKKAIGLLKQLYMPFNRTHDKFHVMDSRSSELTKYASNAMLATKISFMNELANIADQVDGNIEMVRKAMGADPRIGYHFIYPGVGFGGSCFPKDIRGLVHLAAKNNYQAELLQAVDAVNKKQKLVLFEKMKKYYGTLEGLRICIWGLTFKPKTDDIREAPSLSLIESLLDAGVTLNLYDPKGMKAVEKLYPANPAINFYPTASAAVKDADGLALLTEWKEFIAIDFKQLKKLIKQPVLFDGRNIWNAELTKKAGFIYHGIGMR